MLKKICGYVNLIFLNYHCHKYIKSLISIFTLFDPTNKILLTLEEKKMKIENFRKQLKTSQNIFKMLLSIGIDKINIKCTFQQDRR